MSNGFILKKRFNRDGVMVEEDVKVRTYKLEDFQLTYISGKAIVIVDLETKEKVFISKHMYNKLLSGEHLVATIESVILAGRKENFFKTFKW